MRVFLFAGFCLVNVTAAASNFRVPWSSRHYGPDGPWQAVTVRVGGNQSSVLRPEEQGNLVDLLPGGVWSSAILTNESCSRYASTGCGVGGLWQLHENSSRIDWKPTWLETAIGLNVTGRAYGNQAMTLSGHTTATIWNTSMMVPDPTVAIINPNGSMMGPQLGTLSLGAPEQAQAFVFCDKEKCGAAEAWTFPGGLYNQSITPSYSYGLHVGSASLNYTGSLIFGGYDKGRLIGPYTTFGADSTLLKDIGMGVEVGGSPFHFTKVTGLLVNDAGEAGPIPVQPDPLAPYLHLPGYTCDAITSLLPVKFDRTHQYWLWNTDDPRYRSVVTSAAYLSFTFSPAPGDSDDVVIKVPFALLNLTLDTPIVSAPTPYFPCRVMDTPQDGQYRLGRTFLQAAFLGHNWETQTSWLAQAPGPGPTGDGLGFQPQDINAKDTALSVFSQKDRNYLAQSWEGHWTPLPVNESSAGISTSNNTPSSDYASMSTGAKAGIGVGVGCGLTALVVGIGMLLHRRRNSSADSVELERPLHDQFMKVVCDPPDSSQDVPVVAELQGESLRHELFDHRTELKELPEHR